MDEEIVLYQLVVLVSRSGIQLTKQNQEGGHAYDGRFQSKMGSQSLVLPVKNENANGCFQAADQM